jgi:hypothetical protein
VFLTDYTDFHRMVAPFVFYSTFVSQEVVNEAYTQMTVQGFFKKGTSYKEIKSDIKMIVDYWQIANILIPKNDLTP